MPRSPYPGEGPIGNETQSQYPMGKAGAPGGLYYFRKVPGQRRYYDPITGRTLSEYRYRKYIKTVPSEYRFAIKSEQRAQQRRSRQQYSDLMRSYQIKQAEQGNVMNLNQVRSSADFRTKVAELRDLSYRTRNLTYGQVYDPFDLDPNTRLLAPDGQLAEVLVELGKRPAGADWMVGMSAGQPGWTVGEYHG